jgi:hypothetical protein
MPLSLILGISVLSGLTGGLLGAYLFIPFSGWLADRWKFFRKLSPKLSVPFHSYEVRLTRNSSHGMFTKQVYSGEDLAEAKKIYYTVQGPARTTVELWSRGNHTASRAA